MTTANGTVETIKAALNQGGEHVGDLFWWSLSSAEVRCAWLAETWEAAGLDKKALCEVPSPLKAIRRAAADASSGQDDCLIRTAAITNGQIVLAVVRETRDGAGEVAYTPEAKVWVDMEKGDTASDNAQHPIAAKMLARYAELRDLYNADDVRKGILRVLRDSYAVTIRESGGVYWIPPTSSAVLRALAGVISQIGGSVPSILPVHATAEGQQALGAAAKGSLEQELAELKEEVAKFAAEGPEHVRTGTLERRLEAFDALRGRAQLYRDVLAVEVSDLDEKLSVLAAKVQAMLDGKLSAEEAVQTQPVAA